VVQRDDETEAAISRRLDIYNEKTAPLVDFYRREGLLLTITTPTSEGVVNAIRERGAG
jgi:adenylate kinase